MEKNLFPKWNANILLPNGERFTRIDSTTDWTDATDLHGWSGVKNVASALGAGRGLPDLGLRRRVVARESGIGDEVEMSGAVIARNAVWNEEMLYPSG